MTMTLRCSFAAGALALACVTTPASAALPGGISGHWYNPEQSGHGFSVDIIDPERAIVLWHVYDHEGAPLTLYIEGEIHGRRIEGTAYAPRGMVFGDFDPVALQLPTWGSVTLAFDDCSNGSVDWDAEDDAYGSGSLPLQRLAFIDGAKCDLPPVTGLVPGPYRGKTNVGPQLSTPADGVIDGEGRFFGIERTHIAGPAFVGAGLAHAVIAVPVAQTGGSVTLQAATAPLAWAQGGFNLIATQADWDLATDTGELSLQDYSGPRTQRWEPHTDTTLIRPLSKTMLAGAYSVELRDQFLPRVAHLRIDADGSLCLYYPWYADGSRCRFSGTLYSPDGEAGLIDFVLHEEGQPTRSPYRGRGWVQQDANSARELVLVGDDGAHGFGLFATRSSW